MPQLKKFDYQTSRILIIKRLKRDQILHTQNAYDKMGLDYDDFDEHFPDNPPDLMIAWTFWDAWMSEVKQGFPGFYEGINQEKWPKLAEYLIVQLEKKEAIKEPLILSHFDFSPRPSWYERLLRFFTAKQDSK